MAVTIRCPNPACAKSGNVSADRVGHSVLCAHCGTKFKVPGAAAQTPAAAQTRPSDAHTTVGPPVGVTTAVPGASPSAPAGDLPAHIGRFEIRGRLGAGAF